ncbi:MAG: hypothetical protein ACQKBY_12665 [Verrucomicrobiales bacterium]
MRGERRRERGRGGFLLMEAVMALLIFSIMAVSFTTALKLIRQNSMAVEQRMKVTQILDSALTEMMSLPTLEEGEIVRELEEKEMVLVTLVEPLELENYNGEVLEEMYRVRVTAEWYEDNEIKRQSAEAWRNLRLYQP